MFFQRMLDVICSKILTNLKCIMVIISASSKCIVIYNCTYIMYFCCCNDYLFLKCYAVPKIYRVIGSQFDSLLRCYH